jgi:hypothetical protein
VYSTALQYTNRLYECRDINKHQVDQGSKDAQAWTYSLADQ